MKLDGWHTLALGLAMAFVLGLAALAWKAEGGAALWPVVVMGAGAIFTIVAAAFRGASTAGKLEDARSALDAAAQRGADTIPPPPPPAAE